MYDQESSAPFRHWMLREIHEQPSTLRATLDRYVYNGAFHEETSRSVRRWLNDAHTQIVIAASGSSRHAGMVAEILLEDASGIPVDVEYASEYTYRANFSDAGRCDRHTAVLVVSQSGETADTLAALRRANQIGFPTLAITNVPSSTMAREATASFPVAAGCERAVPATKSFTAQLLNLNLLSLLAGESRGTMKAGEISARLRLLDSLPTLIEEQLPQWETSVQAIARKYTHATSFLFLGRGVHYPIAREGALKLKESAYLHAEGYPTGELKHGPNALVSESVPLVMLATVDRSDPGSVERHEKVQQLMEDLRSQGANILAIANTGDTRIGSLANNTFYVRETAEALLPICEVIPLQLFAYFMAINSGVDVDNPRNLVKAVVTE